MNIQEFVPPNDLGILQTAYRVGQSHHPGPIWFAWIYSCQTRKLPYSIIWGFYSSARVDSKTALSTVNKDRPKQYSQLFLEDVKEPSAPRYFPVLIRVFIVPILSIGKVNLIQWDPKEGLNVSLLMVILGSGNDSPFTLEPPFVSEVHHDENRDADIRSNKWLQVKGCLEYREALNQKQKNIEEEIAPIDRNVTGRGKRKFLGIDTFVRRGSANSKLDERDRSPCYISRRTAKRGEIWKQGPCSCLQGHQT